MGSQKSQNMKCEVSVSLPCEIPVLGCEIKPSVRVVSTQGTLKAPPHSLSFSWYREQITCSVHPFELATLQCMSCVKLEVPIKQSYHCSPKCFLDAWQNHVARHHLAAETGSKTKNADQRTLKKLISYRYWHDFGKGPLADESSVVVEREGKIWVKVGSSKTYEPSMNDVGFNLRLEYLATDCSMGTHLSPLNIIVTDPVITFPPRCPRCMIQIGSLQKSGKVNLEQQSSDDFTFSVLSYNILCDLYVNRYMYSYCPPWALVWEYRRKNLLDEILEYDADILCLQEVQSDHFENFFKPELTKCGYSVMYKKKSKEVYTANEYAIDGCATFYRRHLFKEIMKFEVEFDKTALSVVEALEPGLQKDASIRLLKDNVALVVILEALRKGSTDNVCQSRICVANTHIHANPKYPDVKLCQVANLVHGLEKIAQSQIPLLICGDLNSLPDSDPHTFLIRGEINSLHEKETDPFGIYQLLKLQHSLALASAYASLFSAKNFEEPQLRKMNPNNSEPLFTNFTRDFSGTLDYILYTVDSLRVEGLLELLDCESVKDFLPSSTRSSDHIALMASFRLKPPSSWLPPLPSNPW